MFTALPLPLIVLIHLHILDYPRANEPQYDNNPFDRRSKGLKERVKMMEDICYFLVGQLENNNASTKNIFPTYPCSQPSDSLTFRTSLFKYLEALRHRTLFSSTSSSSLSQKLHVNAGLDMQRSRRKDADGVRGSQRTAWWWKDVMVRKSLLEECAGERFESLLVAFSTHVLLHKSKVYTQDQLFALAATASVSYYDMLLRCQNLRRIWLQQASLLIHRRQSIEVLKRVILAKQKSGKQTNGLDHVLTLAKVKYADVQRRLWPEERGSAALAYLLRLAGLVVPGSAKPPLQEGEDKPPESGSNSPARPPLLPLVAARYPTALRRLRRSVLQPQRTGDKSSGSAQLLLSDELASLKLVHKQLSEALRQIQSNTKRSPRQSARNDNIAKVQLNWIAVAKARDILREPTVDRALLSRFSLHDTDENAMKQKLEHIRQHVLPPFPSPPDFHAPRVDRPETEVPVSEIPRIRPAKKATLRTISKSSDTQTPRASRIAKKPAKSIRASLVHNTINNAPEEKKEKFEDEAFRIILATEDNSTEDVGFTTPRSKAPPNRIWTSGQKKTPGSARGTLRRSIVIPFEEPLAKLPLVLATSTGSMTLLDDESDIEEAGHEAGQAARCMTLVNDDRASEDGERSQSSMTLRELLLAVDSSGFELINDEEEDYVEEFSGWCSTDVIWILLEQWHPARM